MYLIFLNRIYLRTRIKSIVWYKTQKEKTNKMRMYYSTQSEINCTRHLKWNKTVLRQSRQPMAETGSPDWLFWRWMTACWRTLCKRHHKHKGIKCHNARLADTSPLLFSRLFFFFLFLESRVSSAARFFRSFQPPMLTGRCWERRRWLQKDTRV